MASRKFIAGIRLCPPASGFASRVVGEQRERLRGFADGKYSNGAGFMRRPSCASRRNSRFSASSACRIIIFATDSISR